MNFHIDFLFRIGSGYDELVALIQANPRYVFTSRSRISVISAPKTREKGGGLKSATNRHNGVIKLSKNRGVCRASVTDESGGLKLIGAWVSWLASNAPHLIAGLDLRMV
jgi:hypothetical protein